MKQKRSSGIILHITSLPSAYGIGDFGPEAYNFAEFLKNTGQKYWQILPINPVQEGSGYSPYSGLSAFAGNPMLISPDILFKDGFVEQKDLHFESSAAISKVDFEEVSNFKNNLFEVAFRKFKSSEGQSKPDYQHFEKSSSYWLEDFAIFMSLKNLYDKRMWTEWPESF
ncbi:MAG: 4-alpha-glucanotransferase, partial [Bacteroidota bacterium]|nr:4-alpha-glucanotransferase [Bacteroidota bacterium]